MTSQPRSGVAAAARRGRTTAQGVVAALALPASGPPSGPSRPPLPDLHRLPRDASMVYGIGRVDICGRVEHCGIVKALGWQAGDNLEVVLTQGAIVIRAVPDGLFSVRRRPRIVIPAAARQHHAVHPGDDVLLAAAPDYGVIIVYPMSALDDMIAGYHSAHPPADGDGHE